MTLNVINVDLIMLSLYITQLIFECLHPQKRTFHSDGFYTFDVFAINTANNVFITVP